MSSKLDIKKQLLKEQIVKKTIEQIRVHGYEKTSMEEIARQTEITKRTLYKYFPVKEAIISEYVRMTFGEKGEKRISELKQRNGVEDRMKYYLKDLMEGVMREAVLFEKYIVYLMGSMVSYKKQESQDQSGVSEPIKFIISSGISDGEISSDMPIELVVDLFLFSFVELTKFYYKSPETFEMEKMTNLCVKLFIKGVGI